MTQFVYGQTKFGDNSVDEYIGMLSGADQGAVQRVYDIARQLMPEAEQSVSYGMPCLKYHGKGLISVMANQKFISLYPFSNLETIIPLSELDGFETTKGSLHFTARHPIPDDLLKRIITERALSIG